MSDTVILGDDGAHYVEGRGKVPIELRGKTSVFKNVLYIPSLKNNCLSVREITSQSPHLDVIFKGGYNCYMMEKKTRKGVNENGL